MAVCVHNVGALLHRLKVWHVDRPAHGSRGKIGFPRMAGSVKQIGLDAEVRSRWGSFRGRER